jgi:hypothetical protein
VRILYVRRKNRKKSIPYPVILQELPRKIPGDRATRGVDGGGVCA